jgi:hypothetical protein
MGQTKQNGAPLALRPAATAAASVPSLPRQAATPPPPVPAARRDAGPCLRVPSQGPSLVLPPPARLRGGRRIRGRRWRPPAAADPEGPLARHLLRRAHNPGEGRGRRRLRRGQGARQRAHWQAVSPFTCIWVF